MAAGGRGRRPPPRRSARDRPPPRRGDSSDLGPRIIVAIPALVFAGVIVGFGDWVFAAGLFLLGAACLHELFSMFDFTHPTRLGGFVGLAGLIVAAQAGDREVVLLAFVATVPVVFLLCLLQPRPAGMPGVSVTMLGLTWIGLACAHAVLLRGLPHGDKIFVIVLVGTFVGDTGAYTRRAHVRDAQARAVGVAEQDGRGARPSGCSPGCCRCGSRGSTPTG